MRTERFYPYRPLTRLPRIRRVIGIHGKRMWSMTKERNFGGWYVVVPFSSAMWHVGRQPVPRHPWQVGA